MNGPMATNTSSHPCGGPKSQLAADIIAVSQDPLRDIKVMERVSFVMRGGAIYVNP